MNKREQGVLDFGGEKNSPRPDSGEALGEEIELTPDQESLYESLVALLKSSEGNSKIFFQKVQELHDDYQKWVDNTKEPENKKKRELDWVFAVAKFRIDHRAFFASLRRKSRRQTALQRKRARKEASGQQSLRMVQKLSPLGEAMLERFRQGEETWKVKEDFLRQSKYTEPDINLQYILAFFHYKEGLARQRGGNN